MELEDLPAVPISWRSTTSGPLRPARLRRAVRLGLMRQVLRGVYLRSDIPLTTSVKLAAAALVINENSVACDRTASWVWNVDVHEFRELDDLPPLETYVLRGSRRPERTGIHSGERDLLSSDWVEINGVKVTTPLRTAMDLGCLLPRRGALAAMDALMRAHGFTQADMNAMLTRYRRRRGVIQLRELVPLVDPRAESQPESWTRLELIDYGLPIPELQWWIVIDGVPTFRLDLAYPHARIAVEYNGEDFHTSPEQQQRDRVRREWLEQHGWTVIVVDRSDFLANADHGWLREVAQALREAQRRPRRQYARR